MTYNGPDRRQESRRISDNCEQHGKNMEDIASLKTSLTNFKWITGLGLTVLTVVLGIAAGAITSSLNTMGSKFDTFQTFVTQSSVDRGQLRSQLEDLKRRIEDLEERKNGR